MTWSTPESRHEVIPHVDANHKLTIIADVRIDNRDELCGMLRVANTQNLGDAELILHAYRKWNTACPERLLGDFAFAIWDVRKRQLFCVRDILGVRQFYYHHSGSHFSFASDIAALLATPCVDRELNLPYLAAEFRRGKNCPLDTQTFYAAIRKLARGHAMVVDDTGIQIRRYWEAESLPEIRFPRVDDYADALGNLLRNAVDARLRTSFPVAAHVSGGLDSSGIGVLAARSQNRRGLALSGFSWAPPPTSTCHHDERSLVEQLRRTEGFEVHYSRAEFSDIATNRLRNPATQQDAGFVHELVVRRRAAANGVRSILSGWGGDELIAFNGRNYFAELLVAGRWRQLYHELMIKSQMCHDRVWRTFYARAIRPLLPRWVSRSFRGQPRPGHGENSFPRNLFVTEFGKQLQAAVPLSSKHVTARIGSRATQVGLLNHGHLTQRIEGWAAAGGRRGISYSYPLLDRRIVEFALGLPPEMFFQQGWKRFLFRHSMQGVLPDEICWAPNKTEPSLSADRDRIRADTAARLPGLIDELVSARDNCHVLNPAAVKRAVTQLRNRAHTPNRRHGDLQSEQSLRLSELIAAFGVEVMVNPDLEQDVAQCVKGILQSETIEAA